MFPDLTRDDVFRIETPRLWLRWPAVSDAAMIARIAGEKEVAEMTATWPHPLPPGETERRIFDMRKGNALGTGLSLVMAPRGEPGTALGTIRATFTAPGSLKFGFMLDFDYWGEGLMTEAIQALTDAVFTLTDAEDIKAGVRVVNPASRRVLEKSGFQMTGTGLDDCPARGGRLPCDHFRLGRRTWRALKGWRAPSFNRIEIDVGINALEASIAAKAMTTMARQQDRLETV